MTLIPPAPPSLGDFNNDGVTNANDGVTYLKAFNIRFATYGVTSDEDPYRAVALPRRAYDWGVQRINDDNLRSRFGIANPEVYPVVRLPNIAPMYDLYPRLPQQYLRELGQRQMSFQFFGGVGRFSTQWEGTFNNLACQMVFWPTVGGHDGRLRYFVTLGVWSNWEALTGISFAPTDGNIAFTRPAAEGGAQHFHGQLRDGRINGTFTQDGTPGTFQWDVGAQQPDGGTTLSNGLAARPGWEIGDLAPQIQFSTGTSGYNFVHEIGHTVWDRIASGDLAFLPEDNTEMRRLFVANASAASAPSVIGMGYWSGYAATAPGEDFAETFAAYYVSRAELERRATTDSVLAGKLGFMRDRVDFPDSGPAAVQNVIGTHFVFMSRHVLRYSHGGTVADLPGVSISRLQPTAVATTANQIRVFAVGTDGVVYHRAVRFADPFRDEHDFTAWQGLPHRTRLPVCAIDNPGRHETYLFMVGNDQAVYFRVLDSLGNPGATGLIPGMQTWRGLGAAIHRGKVYLFAVDTENKVMFTTFSPVLGVGPVSFPSWEEVPTSARVRDGVFALATTEGTTDRLKLVSLKGNFRIIVTSLNGPTDNPRVDSVWEPWREEVAAATVATTPTVTADGWMYVKGFGDGQIYRKRLGISGAYQRVRDL